MDRCRKRLKSDPGPSGEVEHPADKRPCTVEPSTSAAVEVEAAAEALVAGHAWSGMDMDASSGHEGDGDRDDDSDGDDDGDGDGDGDEDGDGDGDGGSSCESDGGGSPRACGGGGRFERMISAVAADGAGKGALVTALTELCEALSFCGEDAGGYFPIKAAALALVRLAGGADGAVSSPDVMLLSMRAITYLCDAMQLTRWLRRRAPRKAGVCGEGCGRSRRARGLACQIIVGVYDKSAVEQDDIDSLVPISVVPPPSQHPRDEPPSQQPRVDPPSQQPSVDPPVDDNPA
ncbi:hypothetical protein GUJ93_ZPchr0002g22956, partial [Zizania palustris]